MAYIGDRGFILVFSSEAGLGLLVPCLGRQAQATPAQLRAVRALEKQTTMLATQLLLSCLCSESEINITHVFQGILA